MFINTAVIGMSKFNFITRSSRNGNVPRMYRVRYCRVEKCIY